MSHTPLRKETNCLNCGATVYGRYCHVCGQENTEPKETFWHMVTHFFYDITHFDGSFFVTLKDLLFKPGFLSREYMLGRRKKYLHPVRMYVFTSAVFFLVFFSMFHVSEKNITANPNDRSKDIAIVRENALKDAKTKEDSANIIKEFELRAGEDDIADNDIDTGSYKKGKNGGVNFSFGSDVRNYSSVKEYDSVQSSLPKNKRDAGITKAVTRKSVELNEKYNGDQNKVAVEVINKFLHSFPYLLFVSLPLYALFLKLLYIRRRKEYYFADHAVFLVHLYIFTFLFLLFYFGLDKLADKTHWKAIGIVQAILVLTGLFYTLKAMKNYYKQGWGKTILKFIIFNILSFISLIILFVVFLVFSFYQV